MEFRVGHRVKLNNPIVDGRISYDEGTIVVIRDDNIIGLYIEDFGNGCNLDKYLPEDNDNGIWVHETAIRLFEPKPGAVFRWDASVASDGHIISGYVELSRRDDGDLVKYEDIEPFLLENIELRKQLSDRNYESDYDLSSETDYITRLSNDRGWLPLQKEESMTVTINDKVYEITRKQ